MVKYLARSFWAQEAAGAAAGQLNLASPEYGESLTSTLIVADSIDSLAAGLPDLVIDNVKIEGDSIDDGDEYGPNFQAGDTVRLDWAVDNRGSGAAGSSRVAIRLISDVDGMVVDTNSTDSISAGGSDTGQYDSFTIPSTLSPGLYGIEIIADDQRVVSESSESNNTYLILIRVEAGRADLVIDNVEINGTSIGRGDEYGTSVMPGDTVRVDWDVDNNGSAAAGASRVAIRLVSDVDGMVVDTNTTDAISAGGSDTGQYDSFVIPSTLPPGLYGIELIADDQDVIDETSESNNDYLFLIRVGEAPPPPPPTGSDEVRQGTDTLHSLPLDELRSGTIEAEPIAGDGVTSDQAGGMVDKDWYKVTLAKGHNYYFGASSISLTTNSVAISLYADGSTVVAAVREGSAPSFTFDTTNQVGATQTYYLAVSAGGPEPTWRTATGDYAMIVQMVGGTPPPPPPDMNDDFRDTDDDTTAALGAVNPGQAVTGKIGSPDFDDRSGDKDVFSVNLVAGKVYDFHLQGSSAAGAALPSGVFSIRDDNFSQLELSGSGSSVHEYFRADRSGLHYVRVGSGGASTDTGGYRLSVAELPPSQIADDWADDPFDTGVAGNLAPATSRTGIIETPGDKDYFTVTLVAGKVYHFSAVPEERPGTGSVDTIALSLRGPGGFNTYLTGDAGSSGAGFDYKITQSGTYFVRVGASDDGGDTGSYRVSVSAGRTPPPPTIAPQPSPTVEPDVVLNRWLSDNFYKGMGGLFDFREGVLAVVKDILKGMNEEQALKVVKHMRMMSVGFGAVLDVTEALDRIAHPEYAKNKAIFVEVTTLIAGLGVSATTVIGGAIWTWKGQDAFRWVAENFWDVIIAPHLQAGLNDESAGFLALIAEDESIDDVDMSDILFFDDAFYLSAYPEVAASIAQGQFGSAYAHFLTTGVDLGYRPNSAQAITRADLALELLNGDPHAVSNSALFTQPLGGLSGDGVSAKEAIVADAVQSVSGGTSVQLDSRLSAIAHRKALDLVANVSGDPVAAAAGASSTWALSWSTGADFNQVFTVDWIGLIGPSPSDSAYRIFVTASSSGEVQDVLARLQAQQGWGTAGFDTFGVAEFGGVWVVIMADRAPGVTVTAVGSDSLDAISTYGESGADTLLTGLRPGRLFGLDGADVLKGNSGNDRLEGGAGNDLLYLTSSASQSSITSGTVTLQPGPEGQDKWVTNVYYGGGVDDHQLKVGGWGDNYNSLIRFDLSGPGLPSQVSSATVRLYYFSSNAGSPAGVLVDKVNTAWTEAYVWNDYSLGYTNLLQVNPSSFGWVDIDVTQTVNGWLANPSSNFGLQLRPTSINNNFTFFVSSDATGDMAANRPKLVLNWGPAGAPAEADVGIGGAGNDIFVIDSGLDQAIEAPGEGNDAIYSSVSYTLAAGSEIETLSTSDREGTAPIDFTGNEHDNALFGNGAANLLVGAGGNDHLDGGRGADRLRGGMGDDFYVVDDLGDVVEELAGEGSDTVWTSLASYSLVGTQIESLGAASDAAHDFRGNSGDNGISGGAGNDLLRLQDGGIDNVDGGPGNDTFFFIGSLTAADIVNGDAGVDAIVLQGNYAGGLALTANVTEIETISILGGNNTAFGEPGTNRHDYVLTIHNSNFAAGVEARINGSALLAGEDFTFDGSAETDARLVVYGGRGMDSLTGGFGNDIFFYAEERFASGDMVNGGAGYDGMFLRGNYTIDFNAPGYTGLFTNIENLTLTSATDERYARGGGTEFDYNLILSDAIVGAGQGLTVSGALLMASESMVLDASLESDGGLRLFGGAAGDTLKGGGQSDLLHGGLGADVLAGNGGADSFRYQSTAESNAYVLDRILDFTAGTDRIELDRIDANSALAGDQAFTWIGSNAFTGTAGQLRLHKDGATWYVQGDTNGDGISDLVIALASQGAGALGAGDFIL